MEFQILQKLTAAMVVLVATPLAAFAQIPVSAGSLHTSSGTCAACDFSDKVIPGLTIRNSDFSGSMFNRSNLSGGEFHSSNLSNTHFRRAFLARVTGEAVNMADSRLQDATLTEAKINHSTLSKANLNRAYMDRGEFIGTNFNQADLTSASARQTNFEGSNFIEARLNHANLEGAKLDKAIFHKVKFGYARLKDASMLEADLSWADLSNVNGITQTQLDVACGNAATRLPIGYSVSYCSEILSPDNMPLLGQVDPRHEKAAKRLERAVERIEKLLNNPPDSDNKLRKELQKAHADLVSARRDFAN